MALTRIVDGQAVEMTAGEEAAFLATRAISAPVRRIAKSVITERLVTAGKIAEAFVALQGDPSMFARWFSPDAPDIAVDNAEAITFLQSIGCDPNEILA